jgi:hypothetical protein
MAYLRELAEKCEYPSFMKKSTVELITRNNYHVGKYCRQHGNLKLKERLQIERE